MGQDARADEEVATQRRARLLSLSYFDTSATGQKPLYKDVLTIPELYQLRVIPLQVQKSYILFGVTNTTSQQTITMLRRRFSDDRIEFALISGTGYRDYMRLYDPPKKVTYQNIDISTNSGSSLFQQVSATLAQVRSDDVLAYLVQQAYRLKASDIHMENRAIVVRIRFRVDGVLHPIADLDRGRFHQLVSSIAVAADISTDSPEAQTGHINRRYRMASGEDVTVNLRVETVPTAFGQDVVMRLFTLEMELLNLDNLGLSDRERKVVDDIIRHPTGLVLVVGPTGSGKTTTMYSLINTLNSDERKIITLEDPIEYYMQGVVQIPVHSDQETSGFGEKLRAVLRLDPDIVMVGEIRDQDTARTSLQAALTGHLVLSTFHASNAAAALTRLLDYIGINPLFASAVRLIMAQRLIRLLDNSSKEAYQPDDALKAQVQGVLDTLPKNVQKPDISNLTLYKPKPSAENPFGYKGQTAIREQLMMTPGIQQLLRLPPNQITTEMLQQKAIEEGMITMLQDGVLKVLSGITTLEEVYRVVG
ncbi:MAG TPA: GspE/PulE family protein [Candidatus Saccharimonadales bacterium]|nr:GspE/PulE family protein [Candidatus Saccharimonadales bacterium]